MSQDGQLLDKKPLPALFGTMLLAFRASAAKYHLAFIGREVSAWAMGFRPLVVQLAAQSIPAEAPPLAAESCKAFLPERHWGGAAASNAFAGPTD